MKRKRILNDLSQLIFRASLLLTLLLASCVKRTVDEGVATYRFAWWAMAGLAVAGAVCIFAARFVPARTDGWYRYTRKIRWGLISTGVIAWFLIVVTYFQKVTVTPDGFTEHLGFFGQKLHQVTYRDLRQVEFISEVDGIGRSRKTNYFFVCFGKEGTQDKVPLSGSCMQAALPEIMRGITAAQVPIVDKSKENSQP
jgi:hypothetical protein